MKKELRYGYTTGSCATAAAKAATYMLFNDEILKSVKIDLPIGKEIEIDIFYIERKEGEVICGVRKDAGDDPDVTHNMIIYAKAEKSKEFLITGGEGIGIVTKKGLPLQVGDYAINPVPRKMIESEVKKVLPEGENVKITIFAPEGKYIAKRTLNPKLGIIGGISILGTTGIVEPLSDEAYKKTIDLEISMASSESNEICLVFGNYGKNFTTLSSKMPLVTMGNYVGFALESSCKHRIKKVYLVGQIGKMIKVAGGIFNTYSYIADARNEIFTAYLSLYGLDRGILEKVMNANTTEEILDLIEGKVGKDFFENLALRIKEKCTQYVKGCLEVEVEIFSLKKGHLAKTWSDFK